MRSVQTETDLRNAIETEEEEIVVEGKLAESLYNNVLSRHSKKIGIGSVVFLNTSVIQEVLAFLANIISKFSSHAMDNLMKFFDERDAEIIVETDPIRIIIKLKRPTSKK